MKKTNGFKIVKAEELGMPKSGGRRRDPYTDALIDALKTMKSGEAIKTKWKKRSSFSQACMVRGVSASSFTTRTLDDGFIAIVKW